MASGELYAFGWIGSALLSAVIASSKNRNGCGWCALGVATGPLALLASVLMPARPAPGPASDDADPPETAPDPGASERPVGEGERDGGVA